MGGLTAAGFAASKGARVVLIEKAPKLGGNALLSGTSLWTVPSLEVFAERAPDGDPALGRVLVERFQEAVDWVASTGLELSPPRLVLGYGRGFRFDMAGYLERCGRIVEAAGGALVTGHQPKELLLDGGAVGGALVNGEGGDVTVTAPVTLLATGGFQGSAELRRLHLGPNWSEALVRANPYSTGDGIRLAMAAGAATAGRMDTFYGHLIGWPLPHFEGRDDFRRYTLLFSEQSVLLGLDCRRFTDESLGDARCS